MEMGSKTGKMVWVWEIVKGFICRAPDVCRLEEKEKKMLWKPCFPCMKRVGGFHYFWSDSLGGQ